MRNNTHDIKQSILLNKKHNYGHHKNNNEWVWVRSK